MKIDARKTAASILAALSLAVPAYADQAVLEVKENVFSHYEFADDDYSTSQYLGNGKVLGGPDEPQVVWIGGKPHYVIGGGLVPAELVKVAGDEGGQTIEQGFELGHYDHSQNLTTIDLGRFVRSQSPRFTVIEYEDGQKSIAVNTDAGISVFHDGGGEIHLGSNESLSSYLNQTNGQSLSTGGSIGMEYHEMLKILE